METIIQDLRTSAASLSTMGPYYAQYTRELYGIADSLKGSLRKLTDHITGAPYIDPPEETVEGEAPSSVEGEPLGSVEGEAPNSSDNEEGAHVA